MQLLTPQHTFDYITPQIAVGTEFDREEIPLLKTHGFDSVLDLRTETAGDTPTLSEYAIDYHRIPAPDMMGFPVGQYKEGTKWLKNKVDSGSKVYVHCAKGLGRSPSMVIAYLIKQGYSLKDAYNFVLKHRPSILITYAQINSLKAFLQNLKDFPRYS